MRETIDHYLLIGMVVAETCRGIRNVRDVIRRRNAEHVSGDDKSGDMHVLKRHRRWAECVVISGLAVITVLYYADRAVPWLLPGVPTA